MTQIEVLKDNILKKIDEVNSRSFENLFLDGGRIVKWQNMEGEEVKGLFDSILLTLNQLKDNINLLDNLGFNIINSLSANFNNFLSQYNGISGLNDSQITNQHHGILNQLQAIGNTLRQYGLYSDLKNQIDIQAKTTELNALLEKSDTLLTDAKVVLDVSKEASLKQNSDRLSEAFSKRAKIVCSEKEKREKNFKGFYIAVIVVSFIFGILFFGSIIVGFSSVWVVVLRILGLLILIPLYLFLYVTHSRFKHEREIEEIYEHKSVISSVVPSYHSMLNDDGIKDKLITSVSDMIINIPEGNKNKKGYKKSEILDDIERVTKVVKSVKE